MIRTRWTCLAAAAVALSLTAAPARAQPQALEARVDALAEEVAELRELAVQAPPIASAVESLSDAVAQLEEELGTLRRQQRAIPDAIETIDELEARVRDLEREVNLLRARLADLEQPVIGSGGAVEHDGGFSWATDDGDYTVTLFGRVQPRYQLEIAQGWDEVEVHSFTVRRVRLGVAGRAGDRLGYKLQLSLLESPVHDAYLDYAVRDEVVLRAGQFEIPQTRASLISSGNRGFAERPRAADALRYDREVGASAHGLLWGDRVGYHAGASNGTGKLNANDNLDLLAFARADAVLFGERPGYTIADVTASRPLGLMVGGSFIYDAPTVADLIGGVPLGNVDVDADGERDVVRVTTATADVGFAVGGLDVALEGLWRREDWGAIVDHPANAAVAALVGGGVENYLGGYGHVTYAAWPDRLVVGARAGAVDQPLLGVGGRDPAFPRAAGAPPDVGTLWEVSAMGMLYRLGRPILGLDYTYFHHDIPGGGPGHRFVVQTQVEL